MGSDLRPQTLPTFSIPCFTYTVDLNIINTARIANIPAHLFLEPQIDNLHSLDVTSFCFLIEHDAGNGDKERYFFDLGPRRRWLESAPSSE